MTNIPDLNRPAFDAAEKRLTAQGHFVINPHRISALFGTAEELAKSFGLLYNLPCSANQPPWDHRIDESLARAVMDADLAAVRSCDAIYLLRGWENSRGAKKELAEAIKCGLEVRQEGGEE
jgi:hypothetical protein